MVPHQLYVASTAYDVDKPTLNCVLLKKLFWFMIQGVKIEVMPALLFPMVLFRMAPPPMIPLVLLAITLFSIVAKALVV